MTKSFFFFTTFVIFAVVSILHFFRLTFELEILIGSRLIPGWISGLAVLATAFMAYWSFKLSRDTKEKDSEE